MMITQYVIILADQISPNFGKTFKNRAKCKT